MQTETVNLSVIGMTCSGCASKVNKALAMLENVQAVNVNPVTDRATVSVTGEASETLVDKLISTVNETGYKASLYRHKPQENEAGFTLARRNTIILGFGVICAFPLFLQMVWTPFTGQGFLPGFLQFVLASLVQFGLGLRFYRGAIQALRNMTGNMDLLIATGTSAAYAYSLYQLIMQPEMPHLFFEASAIVTVMVCIGKWLEERAKYKATSNLRDLMSLQPVSACLLTEGGELDIPIEDVVPGNIIIIRPGETVPVDGILRSGRADINEAMLTGESLPVVKSEGMTVNAGSINETGMLEVEATAIGEDTSLASIVRMVEAAQSGKADIQRMVDRISAVFVPAILAISAAAFVGWLLVQGDFEKALLAAVSVLVIACPCALGLATLTALVVGTGAAAKSGIVISDIDVIERMADIKTVAFDKTGTLTKGKLHISDIKSLQNDERDLVQLLASAQQGSEHFLGRAVVDYARSLQLTLFPVTNFNALPGRGIEAVVNGHTILSGNEACLTEQNIDLSDMSHLNQIVAAARKSLSYVAVDGQLAGVIAYEDELHEEAAEAVNTLQAEGKSVIMLSGDNHQSASAIAEILKLDGFFGALSPQEKVDQIANLEDQDESVLMVGDGINDAPALARATIGVAIGQGADMARSAAAVILLRPDLRLVASTMNIAQLIKRKIRQNLFWALIFNIIGIPLAAMGMLNPVIAGSAMALSSLAVMSNSLLLRKWSANERGELS